jgi:hypothetical protein
VSPAQHQSRPAPEPRHTGSGIVGRRSRHGSAGLPISAVTGHPPVYGAKQATDARESVAVATGGRPWGETSGAGERPRELADPGVTADPPVRPRRRRRVKVILIGLASIAGFAAGIALVLSQRGLPTTASSDSPSSPEVIQPAGQSASFTNPSIGYQLRVPGWRRDCQSDQLCRFSDGAKSPADQMNLYVEVHPAQGKTSLGLSSGYSAKLAADSTHYPRYRSIAIRPQTVGHYRGTVQEFEYANARSGLRHVLIFRTVSADICYEISLNGPANRFARSRPVWQDASESFVLPGD